MDLELVNREAGLTQDISKLISKLCFDHKKQLDNWLRKDQSLDEEKFIELHKTCVAKTQQKFRSSIQLLSSPEAKLIEEIEEQIQEILGRRLKSVFQTCHDALILQITTTEQRLEKVRKEVIEFYWAKMVKRLDSQTFVEIENSHKEIINRCTRKLLHRFPSDLVKRKFLQEMSYMEKVLDKEFIQFLQKWKYLLENQEDEDHNLELALEDLFAEDGLVEVILETTNEPKSKVINFPRRIPSEKEAEHTSIETKRRNSLFNHLLLSPGSGMNNILKKLSYDK